MENKQTHKKRKEGGMLCTYKWETKGIVSYKMEGTAQSTGNSFFYTKVAKKKNKIKK